MRRIHLEFSIWESGVQNSQFLAHKFKSTELSYDTTLHMVSTVHLRRTVKRYNMIAREALVLEKRNLDAMPRQNFHRWSKRLVLYLIGLFYSSSATTVPLELITDITRKWLQDYLLSNRSLKSGIRYMIDGTI